MRFAVQNGSSTVWSAWRSYVATARVALRAPSGTKKVWAQYRDAAKNVLNASDTIVLRLPAVTPTISLKVSGLTSGAITLGKRLTVKGKVTPPEPRRQQDHAHPAEEEGCALGTGEDLGARDRRRRRLQVDVQARPARQLPRAGDDHHDGGEHRRRDALAYSSR